MEIIICGSFFVSFSHLGKKCFGKAMFGVPVGGEVISSSHRSSLYYFEQDTEMSPELLAVTLIIEI